ncbi:MAG TPA: IclR family transcriptional regulator [Paenirhodobacter sp.]
MTETGESGRRRVPAIERAVAILNLLADESRPIGVSEIARALGLPKSSVHGICETLADLDLLRLASTGYAPGPRPLRWSSAYLRRTSLVQEFQDLIARDPALAGYTVTLSTLDGQSVVYLACHNSDRPLGFTFQPGQTLPAVFTATGKAMLALLSPEERHQRLAGPWSAPFTTNGVRDSAAFEVQAAEWRTRGYAVDNGEIREGMVCLGAAVRDADGRPVAGIAISLTSAEARPELLSDLGRTMADFAARLSHR